MADQKKIGQGLQFNVYDRGERVKKMPTSHREILQTLARSDYRTAVNPLGLGREARRIARERQLVMEELRWREYDAALLANAKVAGRTIDQDFLTPFGQALKESDSPEALIDELVVLTRKCWAQGFSETSFNFTINHGVDRNGNVVVLDVGEISFDRDVVIKYVRDKFWLKGWTFNNDLSQELVAYCTKRFDEALTVEILTEVWTDAPRSPDAPPLVEEPAADPTGDEAGKGRDGDSYRKPERGGDRHREGARSFRRES